MGGDANGHNTSEQARRLLTNQQACVHEQGTWAEPHPSSPDMVLLGPMKRDAGSCDFILLSLTWSKVLLRLWTTKLCMPKTL